MRALILLLMLLAPSLTWAGGARMLFLAAGGQFATYTFESNSNEGWSGTQWLAHGYAHTGSYSLAAQLSTATGEESTSLTLATRAGYLDFWHDSGDLGTGEFYVTVNGTPYALATNAGWVHSTDIPVPSGASTTISFTASTSTGTPYAHVDDIRIRIP